MQSNALKNEMAVVQQFNYQPFISILLPFEPKMTSKFILEQRIKATLEKIKFELYENYSFVAAKEVYDKLVHIICNLDYNTHKKGVEILVSSDESKVFYLDDQVDEKYFVTSTFQIRQLVLHQNDDKEFLLVVLHQNYAAVYRGQGQGISKILQNVPDYKRKEGQSEKNYSHFQSDSIAQQTLFESFLQSTDKSLSILLHAFSFPVFVLASKIIINQFQRITCNDHFIAGFIEVNAKELSEDAIETTIYSYIKDWKRVKERYLLQQLESALEDGRLEVGIEDVWNLAKRKNVQLLVIEEGYEYKAYIGKGLIVCAEEASSNGYIKDAVEDCIEKVLADGGKVAFVSNGALHNLMHIAAIRSY